MADRTGIEWTDATWNPVRGCTRVSEGCRHCYAEQVAARFSGPGQPYEGLAGFRGGEARWTGAVHLVERALDQPLRWRKPRRIFVNSMSDLFHEAIPQMAVAQIFAVMAAAGRHTFQALTKRSDRMRALLGSRSFCDLVNAHGNGGHPRIEPWQPLPNVWLGVSVEDQAAADARIPDLLSTPAAVRFLSVEPMLGPVDLRMLPSHYDGEDRPLMRLDALRGQHHCGPSVGPTQPRIDWVICGGESGPGARPMHADWPRSLRDQCVAAGVPFFFKQWGGWYPCADADLAACKRLSIHDPAYFCFDAPHRPVGMWKSGKRAAGRDLDGRTWSEFPP